MGRVDTTRDRFWLGVLAITFVAGLAVSWQRWGNPLIDTGREMNQPLRLADGEVLYANVRHIYGPLSPWLHAELYRLFGPSLSVLYVDGIISAALILLLVYWLARRIMSPAASGAATLSVMWLCALRPAGNYILPYAYDSLHATILSLLALAVLVRARTAVAFLIAGLLAGVTLLAKAEFGIATLLAGIAAAVLVGRWNWRRGIACAAVFLAPALGLTIGVYSVIAARVGWPTLVHDSWLLLYNIPPELQFYNRKIAGLDNPVRSLQRMLIAAIKIGLIAAIVSVISIFIARRRAAAEASGTGHPWRLLIGAGLVLIVTAATLGLDRDKGPFLAMPFLLIGLLGTELWRVWKAPREDATTARAGILVVCTVFGFASIVRMIMHVRSGGAYASFLLPVSVILLTYLLMEPFPAAFRDPRAGRVARTLMLSLILINAVLMAALLGYRYQTRNTISIATARGKMIVEPDLGQAWNEALAYIDRTTRPGDAVAVLPEGTSLDFFSGRRNPLREEIATPGFITPAAEAHAIEQLQASHTELILVTNRLTSEFGPAVFGKDYSRQLMQWIDTHYTSCAMFGPVKDDSLQIGAKPFFIRAYCSAGAEARARAREPRIGGHGEP